MSLTADTPPPPPLERYVLIDRSLRLCQIRSDLVGFGQTVRFGQILSDCWIWAVSVGIGQIRSDSVRHGRSRSDMVGVGQSNLLSDTAHYNSNFTT